MEIHYLHPVQDPVQNPSTSLDLHLKVENNFTKI